MVAGIATGGCQQTLVLHLNSLAMPWLCHDKGKEKATGMGGFG